VAEGLPLREWQQIQGNVLLACNYSPMDFLSVRFPEVAGQARQWTKKIEPQVATTNQVEDLNETFSRAQRASGGDDPPMRGVGVNVGLTVDGLGTLLADFQRLRDDLRNHPEGRESGFEAFAGKRREHERASRLGDVGRSGPERCVFGGSDHRNVEAIVLVAADDPGDLETKIDQVQQMAAQCAPSEIAGAFGQGRPLTAEREGSRWRFAKRFVIIISEN
jgi:hypothetical protein